MYFNDHPPPHFHAEYGGNEALYKIETLRLHKGKLSRRAHNMVIEWADLHRAELMENWNRMRRGEGLVDIEPYLRGPIFEPIRNDPIIFRSVKVDPRMGTIVWDNGADIDLDVLYLGLKPVWMEEELAPVEQNAA